MKAVRRRRQQEHKLLASYPQSGDKIGAGVQLASSCFTQLLTPALGGGTTSGDSSLLSYTSLETPSQGCISWDFCPLDKLTRDDHTLLAPLHTKEPSAAWVQQLQKRADFQHIS